MSEPPPSQQPSAAATTAPNGDPEPSQAGSPPAEEPTPAESEPASPGLVRRVLRWWKRWLDDAEARWKVIDDSHLQRTRLLIKVVLLHVRYTFGYLAFGFLISGPIQLGFQHEDSWQGRVLKSTVLGAACVVPFLILYPLTIIDWGRMRVPEFKNLELGLTRYAAYAAAGWLVLCGIVRLVTRVQEVTAEGGIVQESTLSWLADPRVAWLNLSLMFFAWVRAKFHTLVFREFYTLKPDDDLVILPPTRAPRIPEGLEQKLAAQRAKVAAAPVSPLGAVGEGLAPPAPSADAPADSPAPPDDAPASDSQAPAPRNSDA